MLLFLGFLVKRPVARLQEFPCLVKFQWVYWSIRIGFYNHGNKRLVREDIPENDAILTPNIDNFTKDPAKENSCKNLPPVRYE